MAFRMRTKRLHVEPHGGLSVKAAFHGSETYLFANRRVRVAPGKTYASSINTLSKLTVSRSPFPNTCLEEAAIARSAGFWGAG